jgi:hypothetical protein
MRDSDSISTPEKRPIPVLLDSYERERLEKLAAQWGVSLAGAVRRLIRETEIEIKPEQTAAA